MKALLKSPLLSSLASPPEQPPLDSSITLEDARIADLDNRVRYLSEQISTVPALGRDVEKILQLLQATPRTETASAFAVPGRIVDRLPEGMTATATGTGIGTVPVPLLLPDALPGTVADPVHRTIPGTVTETGTAAALGLQPLTAIYRQQGGDPNADFFLLMEDQIPSAQLRHTPVRDEKVDVQIVDRDNRHSTPRSVMVAPHKDGRSVGQVDAALPQQLMSSPVPLSSPRTLLQPSQITRPKQFGCSDATMRYGSDSGKSPRRSSSTHSSRYRSRSPTRSEGNKDARSSRDGRRDSGYDNRHSLSRERSPVHDRSRDKSQRRSEPDTSSRRPATSSRDLPSYRRDSHQQDPLDLSRMSEEDQVEISFQQVQGWIQKTFPELIPEEPPVPKDYSSFAESQLDTAPAKRSVISLPWSEGVRSTRGKVQLLVTPPGAAPMKGGKFVAPFASQLKYYKIRGEDKFETASTLNPNFSTLVGSSTPKQSFSLGDDDLKQLETSARRTLQISSAVDWQAATAGRFITALAAKVDKADGDSVKISFQDVEALRRVFLSATKSISQLVKEGVASLANATLRRRDSYLKALPSHVSDESKTRLRATGVFSKQLFDDVTLTEAIESTRQTASMSSSLKTVQLVEKLTSQASKGPPKTAPKKPVYASDLPSKQPRNRSNAKNAQRSGTGNSDKPYARQSYPKKSGGGSGGGGSGSGSGQRFSGKGSPRGGRGGSHAFAK